MSETNRSDNINIENSDSNSSPLTNSISSRLGAVNITEKPLVPVPNEEEPNPFSSFLENLYTTLSKTVVQREREHMHSSLKSAIAKSSIGKLNIEFCEFNSRVGICPSIFFNYFFLRHLELGKKKFHGKKYCSDHYRRMTDKFLKEQEEAQEEEEQEEDAGLENELRRLE